WLRCPARSLLPCSGALKQKSSDIKEAEIADIIIRGVPDEVVASLDARASRLGLSRSEYVRRYLAQDAARDDSPVSGAHLAYFADAFGDLGNRDVMLRAWR